MDDFAILVVVLLALPLTLFNLITIAIIIMDKKLRRLPSNYPIGSFLVSSAIQGMIAAPVYCYKKLINKDDVQPWMCDVSRVFYFLCGHTMKMSLLVISVDRLLAIRYPYKYEKVTRRNIIALLLILWLITLGIDLVPFSGPMAPWEECQYVPTREWGLSVIIIFNLIPFILMSVNYLLIWIVAAKVEISDKLQQDSLSRLIVTKKNSADCNKNTTGTERSSMLKKGDKRCLIKFALEMKATKTSLSLIIVYLVCWGPLGLFYMIDHFCDSCLSANDRWSKTRLGIKLLSYSSSLLSPLLYCWANDGYRKASKRVFRKFGISPALFEDSSSRKQRAMTHSTHHEHPDLLL